MVGADSRGFAFAWHTVALESRHHRRAKTVYSGQWHVVVIVFVAAQRVLCSRHCGAIVGRMSSGP